YTYASMAAFWIYDYACSLHEEWTFLHRSHRSKVKSLYIATRYLPFVLLTTNLYVGFTPGGNPGECQMFDNINTGFFILRTYALWNKNRILLAAMLSTLSRAIPGITGCYYSSTSFQFFIPFLLLAGFELELAGTLKPSQTYSDRCSSIFQLMVLAILATRMHLHLWERPCGYSDVRCSDGFKIQNLTVHCSIGVRTNKVSPANAQSVMFFKVVGSGILALTQLSDDYNLVGLSQSAFNCVPNLQE
ncbi:hypothetical protein BD769DRAFT_1387972, partial [Suillus cothurnatus]